MLESAAAAAENSFFRNDVIRQHISDIVRPPDMPCDYKEIIFKREELYGKVWEKPISRLAKEYGISDVGLAKICRRLTIPRPSRGHWARLEFGKKVRRPALPKLAPGEPSEYKHCDYPKTECSAGLDPEILEMVSIKREIIVPDCLERAQRLVREARALLEKQVPDDYGMLSVYRKACLNVRVNRANLGRALRILDALIKGFEDEGFKVSTETDPRSASCVEISGEKLSFSIVEEARRIDHVLPEDETLKQKAGSLWYARQYDYLPTGSLSLNIDETGASGKRKRWSDSSKSRVEEHIGEFINGAILVAHLLKKERLMREEEQRRREEERKRWEEDEKRRREEEARLHNLEKQAEQWSKSEQLRAYIRAVESEIVKMETGEEFKARFARWLSWAKEHADRLDPIKRGLSKKTFEISLYQGCQGKAFS